jgi:tetratricopeptide (TPR) repeat protein
MVTLTVYRGGEQPVQELDLEGPEIRIGRSVDNQVVLPDDGKVVSRVHAVLRLVGDKYVLLDNNSKIGTTVDGKKIKQVVLQPGQEFVIGPFRLVFNLGGTMEEGADLKDTIAGPMPTPVPPETVGGHEGTARPAPSQTHKTQGGASGTVGLKPRPNPAVSWVERQPQSVRYGAGIGALVLLGGVLIWQFLPTSSQEESPLAGNTPTAATTIATTTPTTIPVPVISPEEIGSARAALDAVAATLEPSRNGRRIPFSIYAKAAEEYNRIITDQIQPMLAKDSTHEEALGLLKRAQDGATKARETVPPTTASVTTTSIPADSDPTGVPRRADETDAAYEQRNALAKRDHDRGRSLLKMGDYLEAFRLLSALAEREPALPDIKSSLNNARTALEQARQQAISEGRQRNDEGYAANLKRNFAVAVPALTAAWKLLDRAFALEEPDAVKLVANNEQQRRHAATQIIELAKNWSLDPAFADRARTHFRWVIDLLPDGDPTRKEAESELKKLGS